MNPQSARTIITRRECDVCRWNHHAQADMGGRLDHGEGTGCTAEPVERTYVAVDALRDAIFVRFADKHIRDKVDNAIESVQGR